MKYFLIAGEASGDLHASNLMKEIIKKDSQAIFEFLGGNLMQNVAHKNPVIHYKEMAFMGIFDVVKNLFKIFKNLKVTKRAIVNFQPDVVILVDYPGFNLKIAKFTHQKGFKTHYYIAPKIWAWKEGRIKLFKKYIDKLYIILPFEKDFYQKHNYPAIYVGNPVVDAIRNYTYLSHKEFLNKFNLTEKPIIALLPGSRKSELQGTLNTMLQVQKYFTDYQFVISGAPGFKTNFYQRILQERNIPVVFDYTYDLIKNAHMAIVTSGTATLETALIKTPQVVVYKVGNLQYNLFKNLIKIKYFSLVNLILNKEAVPELIQKTFNAERIKQELDNIKQGEGQQKMLENYNELEELLGDKSASRTTAKYIVDDLTFYSK